MIKKIIFVLVIICVELYLIYYLYKIMTNKPIYAIAVFNEDRIKGNVRFSEDLINDRIRIYFLNLVLY